MTHTRDGHLKLFVIYSDSRNTCFKIVFIKLANLLAAQPVRLGRRGAALPGEFDTGGRGREGSHTDSC